jgi:hypothetical protein
VLRPPVAPGPRGTSPVGSPPPAKPPGPPPPPGGVGRPKRRPYIVTLFFAFVLVGDTHCLCPRKLKLTLFSLIDILWSTEAEESSGDAMPEVPSRKSGNTAILRRVRDAARVGSGARYRLTEASSGTGTEKISGIRFRASEAARGNPPDARPGTNHRFDLCHGLRLPGLGEL